MIETKQSGGILAHVGFGTVTPPDLSLAVAGYDNINPDRVLWDFRDARFSIPLDLVTTDAFIACRRRLNELMAQKRTAIVVAPSLHKSMVETFVASAKLDLNWDVFTDAERANSFLAPH